MLAKKLKKLMKKNRNIGITRISNPTNGAKKTFEI
jgi:hypothetical protein